MEKKSLSPQAIAALEKANQYLSIGHYSPLTIRNYLAELRFIFVYYPDADPLDFTEAMIIQYLLYLSKTLGCSRVKCKMACLLYTSDAADEEDSVDLGGRRIIKKK